MNFRTISAPVFAGVLAFSSFSALAQQQPAGAPLSATTSAAPACPVGKLVLPLDHGPRATTTSALNAKRRQEWEVARRACEAKDRPAKS